MKENFFTNRQGAIGASQIAGLVYYYSDKLLAKNIISQETYNEIKKMEEVSVNVWEQEVSDIKYIESPWSIKEKIKLTAEELELLSKKTSNNNTKRGNELERPVFDKFLQHYNNCEEVAGYNKKASKQYKNFIAIATIDFLVNVDEIAVPIYDLKTDSPITDTTDSVCIKKEYIVEIKTKNTGLDAVGNPVKEEINWISYKLQVAMQMALHKIDNAVIVLQQVATRDKEHDISAELDIEAMVIDCEEDKELIVAVKTVLNYFDADFNNDFKIHHIEEKNNFLNNLQNSLDQRQEAIKNEFLEFCKIKIIEKQNDLDKKTKQEQEAIQNELKEFAKLDLTNQDHIKKLEPNLTAFFEKIGLKKDVELVEFLARKELIMDLPSELNDDISEMSQLEANYNRYCELKDKVEKKLKTIATENQRSVIFRGSPFNVQMTLPTKWSADDIVKKQEANKKDYEASLLLAEGSVKTKSMFKLIKSK